MLLQKLACQGRFPPAEYLIAEDLGVRVGGEHGHTPGRAVKLST